MSYYFLQYLNFEAPLHHEYKTPIHEHLVDPTDYHSNPNEDQQLIHYMPIQVVNA